MPEDAPVTIATRGASDLRGSDGAGGLGGITSHYRLLGARRCRGTRYTVAMKGPQVVILVLFAIILGVPFFVRQASSRPDATGGPRDEKRARLIVVTPHIEQIRVEFARGFDRWHRRTYGNGVEIDYRTPGGTTEILKLLEATYGSAMQRRIAEMRASSGERMLDPTFNMDDMTAGEADFDVMFGGGTFDHDRLRSRGATVSARVGPVSSESKAGEAQRVTLAKPRDAINASTIDQLALIETKATIDGKTVALRVPTRAIEGGARALLPLAEGKASVEVLIRLLECARVFNVRISTPPSPVFSDAEMGAIFGENKIGVGQLYQDDRAKGGPGDQQHWIGVALSGFGIVFNRPLHAQMGLSEPRSWNDLRRPEYAGLLAMADPRQSGSVATLYDSILNAQGFEEGFRTLRDASANARSFSAASTQPPMDVSQGDGIAGVAIDFYGRFQAQAVLAPGQTSETGRLGYIDPPGAVYVDADPVSILRGGPNPEIARRFVEFCMSEEAQTLWQFPVRGSQGVSGASAGQDDGGPALGPEQFVLRRMPIRRSVYRPELFAKFVDKTNLFEIASTVPVKGWRDGMIVMMGSFGIDSSEQIQDAWRALRAARRDSAFPKDTLAKMEGAFYALPAHEMADGTSLEFNEKNYGAISRDVARWRDAVRGPTAKVKYTKFFRTKYAEVVSLYREANRGVPSAAR